MNDIQRQDKTVHFTVDGRALASHEKQLTATAILRLAGLDPARYDLTEARPGHAEPKRYRDQDQVTVHSGDAFLSLRQRAEVA